MWSCLNASHHTPHANEQYYQQQQPQQQQQQQQQPQQQCQHQYQYQQHHQHYPTTLGHHQHQHQHQQNRRVGRQGKQYGCKTKNPPRYAEGGSATNYPNIDDNIMNVSKRGDIEMKELSVNFLKYSCARDTDFEAMLERKAMKKNKKKKKGDKDCDCSYTGISRSQMSQSTPNNCNFEGTRMPRWPPQQHTEHRPSAASTNYQGDNTRQYHRTFQNQAPNCSHNSHQHIRFQNHIVHNTGPGPDPNYHGQHAPMANSGGHTCGNRQYAGQDIKGSGVDRRSPGAKVNMVYIKLDDSNIKPHKYIYCDEPPPPKEPPFRTRAVQTLYRESSAQTLPYLPPVSNDPRELVDMELFKLKDLLPGTGPPGLYEVEVLERERRRWDFVNMLKESVVKSRQKIRLHMKYIEYENVLEKFEWERWLHREEYIQECQMMRLEIVIELFNRREKSMHDASKRRIECSYIEIEKRRQRLLHKNEVELARIIRVVEMQRRKQSRVWRKESVIESLSNPTSDFYAPQMRYGVNPNRRHFRADYEELNNQIYALSKTVPNVDPKDLVCPFAKLKIWSKPKEQKYEIEQNFCSEGKLQSLYENLKSLRLGMQKVKSTPKCLKERESLRLSTRVSVDTTRSRQLSKASTVKSEVELEIIEKQESTLSCDREYLRNLYQSAQGKAESEDTEKIKDPVQAQKMRSELRREEIEALIDSFEGTSIGWLMSFLADEMVRLKEQRRLQFFSMIAKQERWHREAREAGLRQKENYLRSRYESLYDGAEEANLETAQKYVNEILDNDMKNYATVEAEEFVEDLARVVDREVEAWLKSFNEVQTPLNYMTLRYCLRDIVCPDAEKIAYEIQRDADIKYIIEEVLMPEVFDGLESFDIGTIVAEHLVDRLIDNDLYIISTEESSDEDTIMFPEIHESTKEAHAVLRKMIRRSVPGRRWRTPSEREEEENFKDILGDLFDRVQDRMVVRTRHPIVCIRESVLDDEVIDYLIDIFERALSSESSQSGSSLEMVSSKGAVFKRPSQDSTKREAIMKFLASEEVLLLPDPDNISVDKEVLKMVKYAQPASESYGTYDVQNIPNTHSIHSDTRFSTLLPYVSDLEVTKEPPPPPPPPQPQDLEENGEVIFSLIDELLADIVSDYDECQIIEEFVPEDISDHNEEESEKKEVEQIEEMVVEHIEDDPRRSTKASINFEKKPSLGLRLLNLDTDEDTDSENATDQTERTLEEERGSKEEVLEEPPATNEDVQQTVSEPIEVNE